MRKTFSSINRSFDIKPIAKTDQLISSIRNWWNAEAVVSIELELRTNTFSVLQAKKYMKRKWLLHPIIKIRLIKVKLISNFDYFPVLPLSEACLCDLVDLTRKLAKVRSWSNGNYTFDVFLRLKNVEHFRLTTQVLLIQRLPRFSSFSWNICWFLFGFDI